MKKIALTSLLAMVAATAANANVINGNPLYKPAAGHFASVTTLATHTNADIQSEIKHISDFPLSSTKDWALAESFDYGITDDLTIGLDTSVSKLVNDDFNAWSWNNFGLNIDYRIFNIDGWVLDGVAGYSVNSVGMYMKDGDEEMKSFLVKEGTPELEHGDATHYTWNYGVKGGYMGEMFTVAGHVMFGYGNTETFNWNNKDVSSHTMALGLDGQIIITDWLNVTMGVEYLAQLDSHEYKNGVETDLPKNRGTWSGILGLNFNIDETKYVGVYVNGGLHHELDEENLPDNKSAWKVDTGMGMGVKFGIDF